MSWLAVAVAKGKAIEAVLPWVGRAALVAVGMVLWAECVQPAIEQTQRRADCYENSCTHGYPEYIKQKCVCVVGELKE